VVYLLNRGNDRRDLFVEPRTKAAFLKCLNETYHKTGRQVFGGAINPRSSSVCLRVLL
jgi:hypothetical protein